MAKYYTKLKSYNSGFAGSFCMKFYRKISALSIKRAFSIITNFSSLWLHFWRLKVHQICTLLFQTKEYTLFLVPWIICVIYYIHTVHDAIIKRVYPCVLNDYLYLPVQFISSYCTWCDNWKSVSMCIKGLSISSSSVHIFILYMMW